MHLPKKIYLVAGALALLAAGITFWLQTSGDAKLAASKRWVSVLVANANIAAGVTLAQAKAQHLLTTENFPESALPVGVIGNLDKSFSDTKLSQAIAAGQLVLASALQSKSAAVTELQVPNNLLAVTTLADDQSRVAGFVTPGATVAVFWTSAKLSRTRVLFSGAYVLAVGSQSTSAGSQPQQASPQLVTLALSPANSARLILAQQTGLISLGLPSAQTKVDARITVTPSSLFGNTK